jgi:tetratricopeptide (TPR) repeat protein
MASRKATVASRRMARILRIASIPVVLGLLAVAVKLIAMAIIANLALAAYADGDYERSAQYSSWNLTANVIEPHKAHFGLGTAYLGSELFQEARDELEIALETAPLPDSCSVRMNLSYAIEGLGDAANSAGNFQDAADLYQQAITVLVEADESCPPSDERQQALQDKLDQAQQNAEDQQDPQGGTGGQQPPPGSGDDTEGDEPIDNLQDLLDAAEKDKEQNDAADRAYDNLDDFADKPW